MAAGVLLGVLRIRINEALGGGMLLFIGLSIKKERLETLARWLSIKDFLSTGLV